MADDDEIIEPRADDEAALGSDASSQYSTALRALVLGTQIATRSATPFAPEALSVIGMTEIGESGFSDRMSLRRSVAYSDHLLDDLARIDPARLADRSSDVRGDLAERLSYARVDLGRLARMPSASAGHVIAWLRVLVASGEPDSVASVAAAAALLHVGFGGRSAVSRAHRREARRARAFLVAASQSTDPDLQGMSRPMVRRPRTTPFPRLVEEDVPDDTSLIVHGTFSYFQDWWGPGGDFHSYIVDGIRPELYSGLDPFDWSGGYFEPSRRRASRRLHGWCAARKLQKLPTAFAHSYGGVVAMGATTHGLEIDELVLLSVPARRRPVADWERITRAVSLRAHWDVVLAADMMRYPLTTLPSFDEARFPIKEHYLPGWIRRHGASHKASVWRTDNWRTQLAL